MAAYRAAQMPHLPDHVAGNNKVATSNSGNEFDLLYTEPARRKRLVRGSIWSGNRPARGD
jgi:hypothetical protein